MWYTRSHANTTLQSTAHGGRAGPAHQRPPVFRGLYGPPRSHPPGQCRGATDHHHGPALALPRPNRAPCPSRLQPTGRRRAPAPIIAPASDACGLRGRPAGAPTGAPASKPAHLWQAHQPLDPGARGRGQRRRGADPPSGPWRDHSPRPQAAGRALEACQTLDHQSRPGLRPKKNGALT